MPTKVHARLIKSNVQKSTSFTSVQEDANTSGPKDLLPPPYPLQELKALIDKSTILRQCIDAYKRNIPGFGITPQYTVDDSQAETPEMKAEWDKVVKLCNAFNLDMSFEDLFGMMVDDRESVGNAYMEIIRDGKYLPVGGERVDPVYMWVGKQTDPVDVTVERDGQSITRKKRFRKYCQQVGSTTVWFKEFGDPRVMDKRSGQYVEALTLTEDDQANEIVHFKIGTEAYGVPRWIGHLIHIYGARKAEELNYRYFTQGRHTPAAILLHNATLSDDSAQALIDYATAVDTAESTQHKFLVLEAESMDDPLIDDKKATAKIELQSMANMLQSDALFLEYDNSSRSKTQSGFRLPDIYVGRSRDMNRATADTARVITEEMVFEPERSSLEWVINNQLLADHQLRFTKAVFKKPEISNIDEVAKILTVAIAAHAVLPNDLRDLLGKILGKTMEALPDNLNLPAGVTVAAPIVGTATPPVTVQKGLQPGSSPDLTEDFVAILKDVRDVLEEVLGRAA